MMKKGFTLVELLIVIVVIAILTAITFRIQDMAAKQDKKHDTIRRLHALESAIGGYYAAFGSYPPVRLHGSRNIFCKVNRWGIQLVDEPPDNGVLVWDRVHAACRSQPLAMSYPSHKGNWAHVRKFSRDLKEMAEQDSEFGGGSTVLVLFDAIENTNRFDGKEEETEWTELNLFKFGLMSFLLPRYLYMMQGDDTTVYDKFAQWGDNNNVPCKFEDGIPYNNWKDMANEVQPTFTGKEGQVEINRNAWKVALLPSQIVTARWIACLEHICFFYYGDKSMYRKMWGVELAPESNQGDAGWLAENEFRVQANDGQHHRHPPIYTAADQQQSDDPNQPFMPDGVTVWDAWKEEFYYYSPPPHQGYRLWSAGPDLRTFPPWISEDEIDKLLSPSSAKIARSWTADDIVHMSN